MASGQSSDDTSQISMISASDLTETDYVEDQRTNPFDACLLETLHRATFTPSIFAQVVSPNNSSTDSPVSRPTVSRTNLRRRRFRWSIDHLAALSPAQIDETELALQESCQRYDDETEARLQAAIDQFFSQPIIAPSPWKSTNGSSSSCEPVLVETPMKSYDARNTEDDLESEPRNTRDPVDDDINSSVYLLSSSPDSPDSSPALFNGTPGSMNGISLTSKSKISQRTSVGMENFSSPDLSPIKHLTPTLSRGCCSDETETTRHVIRHQICRSRDNL